MKLIFYLLCKIRFFSSIILRSYISSQFIFYIFIFLLLSLASCKNSILPFPRVENGVLRIQNGDLENGVVKLNGEWEFYHNQFLTQDTLLEIKNSRGENSIKPYWLDFSQSWEAQNLPSLGYGTYVLKVTGLKEGSYSLYLGSIKTAYTVEINGVSYGGLGKIAKEKYGQISELKKKVITFFHKEGDTYIILCVSNYEYAGGGINQSSYLGRMEDIYYLREKNIVGDIFLSGIFLFFGLYHFALYAYRKKDDFTLWFGIFCILIGIRVLVNNDRYIYDIFPFITLSLGFRLEYLTMYLGAPVFFIYLKKLYPEYFNYKIYTYSINLFFILSFVIFWMNQFYYNKTLVIVQLLILINILITLTIFAKMVRKKVSGARTFLFAVSLFFMSVVYDLVVARFLINTPFIVPYGLFIFIFFQSIIIVKRFSAAFERVENLSNSLILSNQELESMTKRATDAYLDLETTQRQLLRSDRMVTLGTMVAGVAHEINTPLSAIRANAESIPIHLQNLFQKIDPKNFIINFNSYIDIQNIVHYIQKNQKTYSTKEIRQIRKKISETLIENGYKNIDYFSDTITELGMSEDFINTFIKIEKENLYLYLLFINEYISIDKKSSVILTASERVSKIVKSLKSFMHFEEKEEKVLSDLKEGMETVLIIMQNKIKYGIEVIKNYGDIPQILCYPDELNQVWTNLIHNAVQAMGSTGILQIDLEKVSILKGNPDIDKRNSEFKGNYISIAIQDNGPGIPPEIRTKIFQAFFTTKPAGEGSGLGLHIIGKILEKHSGALYLDSERGRTRFTIVLPEER